MITSMGSIEEIRQEIKAWLDEIVSGWGTIAMVLLVGFGSFGLGRLSAIEDVRPPVSVFQASPDAKLQAMNIGGLLVASWNGSAYHYPWCPGASKISSQNQRWFASAQAARDAGLMPAKNCKGLEK